LVLSARIQPDSSSAFHMTMLWFT